jgi:hypothetical protein
MPSAREQEKSAWQASERKRMSYSTLNDRADAAALKLENKRDQKQMDEHAARQAYYKPMHNQRARNMQTQNLQIPTLNANSGRAKSI